MLTEELITDQLVIDLKDHLDKFCILKVESLDLNKVLNICCSNEAANQQFEAMQSDDIKAAEDVHPVKDNQVRQKR